MQPARIDGQTERLIKNGSKLFKFKHNVVAYVLMCEQSGQMEKSEVEKIMSAVYEGYLSQPPTREERDHQIAQLTMPKREDSL